MLSRVPDHSALGLLVTNPQGSLTVEENLDQVHSRVKKWKTRSNNELGSYEVEEILGHRQDNQASI